MHTVDQDFLNSPTLLEGGAAKVPDIVKSVIFFMNEIITRFRFLTPIIIERLYDQWIELSELEISNEEIVGLSDFSKLTGEILRFPIQIEDNQSIKETLRRISKYKISNSMKKHFHSLLPDELHDYFL